MMDIRVGFKTINGEITARIGDIVDVNLSHQGKIIEINIEYFVIDTGIKKIKFFHMDVGYLRFYDKKLFEYKLEDIQNG
jgi:hypothetical protein